MGWRYWLVPEVLLGVVGASIIWKLIAGEDPPWSDKPEDNHECD